MKKPFGATYLGGGGFRRSGAFADSCGRLETAAHLGLVFIFLQCLPAADRPTNRKIALDADDWCLLKIDRVRWGLHTGFEPEHWGGWGAKCVSACKKKMVWVVSSSIFVADMPVPHSALRIDAVFLRSSSLLKAVPAAKESFTTNRNSE